MTKKDSAVRLTLYVLIAVATTITTGIGSLDASDPKNVIGFVVQVVLSGLITARAYIDQTPNQITDNAKNSSNPVPPATTMPDADGL